MPTKTRFHVILLCLILGLGFGLRFSQPTLVEFKRDEATIARLGQAIAYEGYLPAVGVDSSLGIDNLPLTLYLAAVPLRLWSDPEAVVLFTILLNSLALPACYLLARSMLGKRAALLSTTLFAVSPWAVLYARKIWSRTLPIFALALIASLFLTFVRRRKWALVLAFASLAGLLGLQLEALAYIPVLALAILLYRDAVEWRPLLVGVLVFGLLLLPYAVHDALNGWENARGLMSYAGGEGTLSLDALRYALMLIGSKGIEGQAGSFHRQFASNVPPFWWLNDLLSALMVCGFGYGLYQAIRGGTQERRRSFSLMLLWFGIPMLLQLKPSAPTQQHYFVMHYPVQYMLIAAVVAGTFESVKARAERAGKARLTRFVGYGLLVLLLLGCGWQVLVTWQLRVMMVEHPTTGGYGIPLRYSRTAARQAEALAGEGEVIVLSQDTRLFLTETPTVFDALLFGTPHRFADPRAAVPFPQRDRFAYLVGPIPSIQRDAPEASLLRLAGLPSITPGPDIQLRDGAGYRTYLWQGERRDELLDGMTPLGTGVPFANNAVFAAYQAPSTARAGETIEVWLAWWLRDLPPSGVDMHFTAQVLDETGDLQGQDDHAGFASEYWQAGDLVLSRFAIALPDELAGGTYRLRIGMYSYPDIRVVPVVDVEGVPIDDGLTLTGLVVSD